MFWGCPCTQAVLGPVLESLPQGVSIRPAHLWLLEAPSPCVRERDWWVLALSALNAISRFRRQFAQGGVAQVREATTSFLQTLLGALSEILRTQRELILPPYEASSLLSLSVCERVHKRVRPRVCAS